MRKEAFFEFGQIEGRRERRERHRKKAERVFENERSTLEGQHLGPDGQLFLHGPQGFVKAVDDKNSIEPLQVVEDDDEGLFLDVFIGGVSIILQMLEETVHAIFSFQTVVVADDGDGGLPFSSVTEEIGVKATLLGQQTLDIRVDQFRGWYFLGSRLSIGVSLLRGRWLKRWLNITLVGFDVDRQPATVTLFVITSVGVFFVHFVSGKAV